MSELTPLLIGLVGTIIGAAPMVLVALINRGKTQAEGSSILSAAYVGLVKPQAEVIDRLKLELAEQTKQANEWQRKYNRSNSCAQTLYYFCIDHNLIPPSTPDGVADKLQ